MTEVEIYLSNKKDNQFNDAILRFLKENMTSLVTSGIVFRIFAHVDGMPAFERLPAMITQDANVKYGIKAIQLYLLNKQMELLKNTSMRSKQSIQGDEDNKEDTMGEGNSIKDDMRRMLQRRNCKPMQPPTEIPEKDFSRKNNISVPESQESSNGVGIDSAKEEEQDLAMVAKWKRNHKNATSGADM
jgi:hypothetical protein